MNILDYFIRKKVRETARQVIRDNLPQIAERITTDIVGDLWEEDALFRFLKWMQWELQRVDPTLSAKRSFRLAKGALACYLQDEGIKFGDPRYSWDQAGAKELIYAYEIEHWETMNV